MGHPKAYKRKSKQRDFVPVSAGVPSGSTAKARPLFCFQHVDSSSKNEWNFKLDADQSKEVMDFICEMARLTWGEIDSLRYNGKKGQRFLCNHTIEITAPKFSSEACDDLRRRKLDQTFGDTMYRFRVTSKKRLWGFRHGEIFHVVWWDPKHKVYPMDKS